MAEVHRPLSPHLQIWRWGMNMALSIMHRATGMATALGALLLVWWIAAVAMGPDAYAFFLSVALSPIGRLVLFAITLAAAFHAMTGIRHLLMDAGFLLDKGSANAVGVVIIVAALALAVGIWTLAYWFAGLL
ncbi:MAG: succinate dehydrogenase, cytochrome b556 subunit [Rhodothalassiaceae bacterium]|nr:MAG: succinate dehydrogenase, cytochrome b556 subunit [Rhodothalassiaceae bacterium]